MTDELLVDDAAAPPVRPGYCSDHPNQRLVSHRAARLIWHGPPIEIVCPDPIHEVNTRERCRWCGGELLRPDEIRWRISEKRAYCSSNHRLRAFRAAGRAS